MAFDRFTPIILIPDIFLPVKSNPLKLTLRKILLLQSIKSKSNPFKFRSIDLINIIYADNYYNYLIIIIYDYYYTQTRFYYSL